EALDAEASSPALRQVLDDVLDGVDELLRTAAELPRALRSRRLAAESTVILEIARRLAQELRQRDPLAERIELDRTQFALCGVRGVGRAALVRVVAQARRGGATRGSVGRSMPRPSPDPKLDAAEAHVR